METDQSKPNNNGPEIAGFKAATELVHLGEAIENQNEHDPRQSTELIIILSEHILERADEICAAIANCDVITLENASSKDPSRAAEYDAKRTQYMSSQCSPQLRTQLAREILEQDDFVFAIIQPFVNSDKQFHSIDLGGQGTHEAAVQTMEAENQAAREFLRAMPTASILELRAKFMTYLELGTQSDLQREPIVVNQLTDIAAAAPPLPDRRTRIAAIIGLNHWAVDDTLTADDYMTQRVFITDRTHLAEGQDFELSYEEQIGHMLREPDAQIPVELQNRALLERIYDVYIFDDGPSIYRARTYEDGEGDAAFVFVSTLSDEEVLTILNQFEATKISDEPRKVTAIRASLRANLEKYQGGK
jgi:hypothetical protein